MHSSLRRKWQHSRIPGAAPGWFLRFPETGLVNSGNWIILILHWYKALDIPMEQSTTLIEQSHC